MDDLPDEYRDIVVVGEGWILENRSKFSEEIEVIPW